MVNEVRVDRNVSAELIKAPGTLSAAYQDIGELINVKGLLNIALWLKGSLNDSDVVKFRCKCFPYKEATDYFYTQIQTVDSTSVTLTQEEYAATQSDIKLVVPLGISQLTQYIRLEMAVGVAGATPAEIDKALLTFEREAR